MKKRVLAILLCAAMVISAAAGCSSQSSGAKAPESTTAQAGSAAEKGTGEKLKITLASFPDQPKDALTAAIDNAKLDFDVEIVEYPQNEYENKIKMAFGSQSATDLILMDAPNVASYASSGVLEPLDTYWDKSDFGDLVPSSQTAMTWNGKIWAAPLNEANTLLFYNKDVFDQLGIKAPTKLEDAWTFDQLLDICKKVTIPGQRYAIQPQMFTMDNKNEGMTFTEMLWPWMSGGEILSPDATKADGFFNSEASKKGINFFAQLYKNGYASTEATANAFETGKVVMWVNGPWMIGTWKKDFPNVHWGAMPMPKDAKGASGAGSWNIAVSKSSQHKKEAWQVVQAITGVEGQKIWCSKTGNLPARKSVLDSDPTYKQYPYDIINQQLVTTAKSRPVTPAYPQISEALDDCFNAVAFGGDVNQAVDTATQKMETALKGVK